MYDKSEGSRSYNKNERGGWYCTNPRKHHDTQLHHGSDDPHNHTAKRNDTQPRRQPESRQSAPHQSASRQSASRPSDAPHQSAPHPNTPQPASPKAFGCGCACVILILFFVSIGKFIYTFTDSTPYDYDYDYGYDEVIADTINEVYIDPSDTLIDAEFCPDTDADFGLDTLDLPAASSLDSDVDFGLDPSSSLDTPLDPEFGLDDPSSSF